MFDQKSGFCHFLKKIIIFSKIWYQKWILWLISISEMYTYIYITVIVSKLQHSICFKYFGFTPLLNEYNAYTSKFPKLFSISYSVGYKMQWLI